MIRAHAQCDDLCTPNVNKNKDITEKNMLAKLGQAVTPFSIFGTSFPLFVQQTCQNIARINIISLVY